MKKTLITLLALGGLTFGATTTTTFTQLGTSETTVGGITYAPGVELAGLPFTDDISIGSFTNTAGNLGGKLW